MIEVVNTKPLFYFKELVLPLSEVQRMYDTYFFANIKAMVEVGIDMEFMLPDAIVSGVPRKSPQNLSSKDFYLLNGFDKLGEDIESKGMYWPFFVQDSGGVYTIREGTNRIYGLKNVGSTKKFLTVKVPVAYGKTTELYSTLLSDNVEFYLIYPTVYVKDLLKQIHPFNIIEKVEADVYKVESTHLSMLLLITSFMGSFLSSLMYRYKNEIIPNVLVNNEVEFEYWKKGIERGKINVLLK